MSESVVTGERLEPAPDTAILSAGDVHPRMAARVRWSTAVRWPRIVVAATTGLWAFTYVTFAVERYVEYRSTRFDLGNMTQAIWSTASGNPLEVTTAAGEQVNRLGIHVDPILALLAPLWWAVPSPLLLVVLQPFALAAGVVPLFALACARLRSEGLAAAIAIAYLLYPWVAWQALDAFHPVTLAVPLLLAAVWALETERMGWFALAAFLALLTGELVGLALIGLGIWHGFSSGRVRRGAVIAAAGAAWTALCLWVVIPAFSSGNHFYDRYESVGGSPTGLVKTLFTDPGALLAAVTSANDVAYVLLLVLPLAAFPLVAPLALAGAVPQLALNLLSDWPATTSPIDHYVAVVVPFLFLATIVGIGKLDDPTSRRRGIVTVLSCSAAATFAFAPWPAQVVKQSSAIEVDGYRTARHRQAVREALSLIPEDAAVTTTNKLGAHLSARQRIYSVPVVDRANWVVLDLKDPWFPAIGDGDEGRDRARMTAFADRVASSTTWRRVFARDDVLVYRRAS